MDKTLRDIEASKYDFIHELHDRYGLHSTRYAWFEDEKSPFVKEVMGCLTGSTRILDMGCGKCGFISFFSERYKLPKKRFHGMDISEKAIEGCPSDVITTIASIDDIPSKDRHFTTVLHFDGMEHIPVEIESGAMQEMMRVADKFVILTIHMGGCIEDALMKKNGHGKLHVNIKGYKDWTKFLEDESEKAGFTIRFIENHRNHVRVILERE